MTQCVQSALQAVYFRAKTGGGGRVAERHTAHPEGRRVQEANSLRGGGGNREAAAAGERGESITQSYC